MSRCILELKIFAVLKYLLIIVNNFTILTENWEYIIYRIFFHLQ